MAYIGNDPSNRFVAPKAASVFSGDGSTTAFTLDHAVGSDEDILVSVDGVIQEPSVAYAVSSGTTLTFTAAPSSNSGNNIFVYYLFRTVGTVSHPSNNALQATDGTFTGALSAKGGAVFNEDSADVDFRVESNDEANMLVVDGGNNAVVIGQSAPDTTISGDTPAFQVIGAGADSKMALVRRVASASAPSLELAKSRNTSVGSHTIVQDDDTIGEINFFADDGTDLDSRVATIKAQVDGTPGANDTPGRLVFMTSADGSNSPTERMRIDDSGRVSINLTSTTSVLQLETSNGAVGTEASPHLQIASGGVRGYSGFHFVDDTAYYIGQNSAIRQLRLYSGAEGAGVVMGNGATSFSSFSDERIKEDVEPISNGLQKLADLRCVSYRLKDVDVENSKKKLGIIAQDLVGKVDEVIDLAKRKDDETEYMSVRYTEMIPVLIKAIQELSAKVAALESK